MSPDNGSRWRSILPSLIWTFFLGIYVNQVSASVPRTVVYSVLFLAAVTIGIDQVPKGAPLARALPSVLLFLAVAATALTMTTPPSWTGPVTMISAGLIAIFVIASENRAVALTSLAGIGLFAAGLVVATNGDASGITGHVGVAFLGSCLMIMGLVVLILRRELFFGPTRITTAKLREYPSVMWGRGTALGLGGVIVGVEAANSGRPLAAVLLEIGGLSWLGVMSKSGACPG
jgi:hypothetical protein